jgi:hypothetical protein
MSALPFGLTSIVQVSYMHQPLLTCRGKPTRGGEAGRDWAFMVQLKHCCAEDAAANCSTWEVPPPRRPAAPGEGAHLCWRRPRASLGAGPGPLWAQTPLRRPVILNHRLSAPRRRRARPCPPRTCALRATPSRRRATARARARPTARRVQTCCAARCALRGARAQRLRLGFRWPWCKRRSTSVGATGTRGRRGGGKLSSVRATLRSKPFYGA